MEQGYSKQFKTASVVIEAGENPLIVELVQYAHSIGAIWRNQDEGIDIVVDDQSGHYDRSVGVELYEEDMLWEQVAGGQEMFHALVS